ncbi:probable serine/threonine-protein kinase PBL7 [Selaginella moellendorffii]|nr:probable serine/threonine-protein kinase PBL7 [Selaginella moellendorffii]|eukprot:XP_002990436.2 probable serine/threonine-protein kinase PBL7 [Selaginella moellendorffii]
MDQSSSPSISPSSHDLAQEYHDQPHDQAGKKFTTTTMLAVGLGISSFAAIAMLLLLIYQKISHRRKRRRTSRGDFTAAEDFMTQRSDKSTTECMLMNHSSNNSYSSPSPTPRPVLPPPSLLTLQISPPPNNCSGAGGEERDHIAIKRPGPQPFSLHQLQIATNSFSERNIIGRGGFGCVYRGILADGRVAAVKKLDLEGKQGEEEFCVEIEMLSRVQAPKLLELLGYCTENEHRLLVYEYMAKGNLQQHLYPDEDDHGFVPLDWTTRLKIALDAAKGLEFLHEFVTPPIIHRDFKCSNILLDDKLNAKLSDFGLAKVGSNKVNGDVSTRVLGTHGYVAPEYVLTGHLTTKSDVYSFGVVLLEILTGRVPVDMKRPAGEGVLVSWALPRLTDRDKLVGMVDQALAGQYSMKELIQVAAIAAMCIQPEADYRPLMIDVVQSLAPLVKQRLQNRTG